MSEGMVQAAADAALELVVAWDAGQGVLERMPAGVQDALVALVAEAGHQVTAGEMRASLAWERGAAEAEPDVAGNYVVIDDGHAVAVFFEGNAAIAWREAREPSRFAWSVITTGQADQAGIEWRAVAARMQASEESK